MVEKMVRASLDRIEGDFAIVYTDDDDDDHHKFDAIRTRLQRSSIPELQRLPIDCQSSMLYHS